jgi:Cupin-like domain
MPSYQNPGISFDAAAFDPMRIMPVRHHLAAHPLLEFGSLVDLAKRLERAGAVRAHNDTANPGTSFNNAPETHPIQMSVEDTIRRIETSKAWMALHNIQKDDIYRKLVDEVLDWVRPMVTPKDPGLCHRAGWIFVTSPGAVTPYHLDHEHNFILQILGKKTIHVFDPLDRSIVTEEALEAFHMNNSRELVKYKDDFQSKAHVFDAEPGMGAYMPTTAPHWVKNGDNVSITVSFTYYTEATLARKALHRANFSLRKLGLSPRPTGESPLRDNLKSVFFRAQEAARRRIGSKDMDPVLLAGDYAIG